MACVPKAASAGAGAGGSVQGYAVAPCGVSLAASHAPYVLEGAPCVVTERLVDGHEHIKALAHLASRQRTHDDSAMCR